MGTFLEFYTVDKNKVPQNTLEHLVFDKLETARASDQVASFFDLTIDWEFPDIIQYIQFARGGQIRRVVSAFMLGKGITDDIFNTSMVVSKQLVIELLAYLPTASMWDPEDIGFMDGEKEHAMAFFQDVLDNHDFDTKYFFYTYY